MQDRNDYKTLIRDYSKYGGPKDSVGGQMDAGGIVASILNGPKSGPKNLAAGYY